MQQAKKDAKVKLKKQKSRERVYVENRPGLIVFPTTRVFIANVWKETINAYVLLVGNQVVQELHKREILYISYNHTSLIQALYKKMDSP